jgi:hypothetical protein
MKKIIIAGDIHGEWAYLNAMINRQNPNIILQCGDYGYWRKWHNTTFGVDLYSGKKLKPWNQYGVKNRDCLIYWCDGNHEDHWAVKKDLVETGNLEMQPGIFYQPRGSTITLPDSRTVMFIGGAESIDKKERICGVDWFPDEIISYSDIETLPDCKVDIIVSHTAPREFYENIFHKEHNNDTSMDALSLVLQKYKPALWYFGHFHTFATGKYESTRWWCLNKAPDSNWWINISN